MTPARQTILISALAVAGFFGLRALPDTQCAFLHADHQPVVVDGLEFCGVNEEANFYSPAALRFPVALRIALAEDGATGELRLERDEGRPYYSHEVAISHTEKVHLHLRQAAGGRAYAHLHPVPADDGSWRFEVPAGLRAGTLHAYVDFADARTGRVMLAQAEVVRPPAGAAVSSAPGLRMTMEASTLRTGQSATLRLRLEGPAGRPVKLRPVMGSLGHAVVFSVASTPDGYAHMHPTLEGGEYAADPTLAFRLRLPAPGSYDLWLQVDDGSRQLLRTNLQVTP